MNISKLWPAILFALFVGTYLVKRAQWYLGYTSMVCKDQYTLRAIGFGVLIGGLLFIFLALLTFGFISW